ncbi:MAG: hypothetical protein PF436_03615 [Prolixibacteraceae bacterium]|nr:hypothetical protein [Prolixibacteraceae bacterium]
MYRIVINSFLSIFILFICFVSSAQPVRYVSLQQQTEILEGKRKNTNNIEIYFDNQRHIITRCYHSPKDMITVANSLGEIKTYNPKTREVSYQRVEGLSSKNNVVFFFVNNLTDHLGLADQGFTLVSNQYEGQYYVSVWEAPVSIKNIAKVKMAHQNGVPVYSEYLDNKGKALKKTYYTGYYNLPWFRFPQKVIDIAYQPGGDSTITRTMYKNIEVSDVPDSEYFNFEIPEDAKSVEIN